MNYFIICFSLITTHLLLAGCDSNHEVGHSDITLSETSINTFLNRMYTVSIGKGSGSYSAAINNAEVAAVSIEAEESTYVLLIKPQKEGEAMITVTDNKSGQFATCALTVEKNNVMFSIVSTQYAVDAEQKETIETDLRDNPPVPVGSSYEIAYDAQGVMVCVVLDSTNTPLANGRISSEQLELFPTVYSLIPIENQIYAYQKWNIDFEGKELAYDVFLVRGSATQRSYFPNMHFRFYEDLTEAYKIKYPDAGVRGVVRAQFCTYW